MKLDPKLLLPTVIGAFVVLVGFLFWYKGEQVKGVPPNHPTAAMTTPSGSGGTDGAANETPSKDNVSHTFLAEENRLRMAIQESPTDTTSLIKLARISHDAHNLTEAADLYARYLALQPNNSQAWADLADCYVNLGDMGAGLQAMESGLEHFPGSAMMVYNLGAIHANMGKLEEARRYWTRVQEMDADDAVHSMATAGLEKLK